MAIKLKKYFYISLIVIISLVSSCTLTTQAKNIQGQAISSRSQGNQSQITSSWNKPNSTYDWALTGMSNVYDLPKPLSNSKPLLSSHQLRRAVYKQKRIMVYQGAEVNHHDDYYRIKSKDNQIRGWVNDRGVRPIRIKKNPVKVAQVNTISIKKKKAIRHQATKRTHTKPSGYRITKKWIRKGARFDRILNGKSLVYNKPALLANSHLVADQNQINTENKRSERFKAYKGAIVNHTNYYYKILSNDHRIRGWVKMSGTQLAPVSKKNRTSDLKPGQIRKVSRQIKEDIEKYKIILAVANKERKDHSAARATNSIAGQYIKRANAEANALRNNKKINDRKRILKEPVTKIDPKLVSRVDDQIKSTSIYSNLANHKNRMEIINSILDQIIRSNQAK